MGAFSERICAQILQVPSTSQRVFCRTFVAVPAPLHKEIVELGLAPRGQTSERRCQQIVEVSAPQVAEPFCVGMFEHAEKEEWLLLLSSCTMLSVPLCFLLVIFS